MNVKPGVLAWIIAPTVDHPAHRKIVEVLSLAPNTAFTLPSGDVNGPANHAGPRWVCRSAGSPLEVWCYVDSVPIEKAKAYLVIAGQYLRAIPGDLSTDDTTTPADIGTVEAMTA